MKLIEDSKLRDLLIQSEILRRLECMGVDNWNWYEEALFRNSEEESIKDWEETKLSKIMEEYRDYYPKEFDNYNFD